MLFKLLNFSFADAKKHKCFIQNVYVHEYTCSKIYFTRTEMYIITYLISFVPLEISHNTEFA